MKRRKALRHHSKLAKKDSLRVEQLEARVLLNGDYRTIDGTGNNVDNPDWGSTDQQLLRHVAADYADGISEPAGGHRPSPRAISNAVSAQSESIKNNRHLTDFVWQWGQFLDHDIGLTEGADPEQPFDIPVPAGDTYFDPTGTGTQTIGLTRSTYDSDTGEDVAREQMNGITAYIDASNVYGSDQDRADFLRTFEGGKLKVSDGNLLPYNDGTQANATGGVLMTTQFVAGDVRANEQIGLIAMHTLFMREHNRLADEIAADEYPDADLTDAEIDEEIYQEARRIVGAQMQAITYNEFRPALLGYDAVGHYYGYDSDVNAGLTNVFSTAGYRLGHSMLSSQLLRLNNDGSPIPEGPVELRDAFFRPGLISDEGGIGPVLKGLASQEMQEIDVKIIDDVRNFLFGPPGAGGFDLASLNMQRGREHGLGSYNDTRVAYGLAPMYDFSQMTSNPDVAEALASVYDSVDDVDVWIGALAEDHLPGSSVGELTHVILVHQFENLRSGDRFWYENSMSYEEIAEINNTTLADIIRRNTEITNVQDNVFYDASVMYYRVATGESAQQMHVKRSGWHVVVTDQDGTVHARQKMDETSAVKVVGAAGPYEPASTFVVDATLAMTVPDGVSVYGGDNGGDALEVWGRQRRDYFLVYDNTVFVNSIPYHYYGMGDLKIHARGGNDLVTVKQATPAALLVDGGNGYDRIYGGPGDEWLLGGSGHDHIYAGAGSDYVDGGYGHDVLYAQSGDNILRGGVGADKLYGASGRDMLIGGYGPDYMLGGAGDDLIVGGRTTSTPESLIAVMKEWTSYRSFDARMANIRGTNSGYDFDYRLNGDHFLLPYINVFDDGTRDTLHGRGGRDWVFHALGRDVNLGADAWDASERI